MIADGWDACQGEGCRRDRAAATAAYQTPSYDGTITTAAGTDPPPPPPRPPGLFDDANDEPPPPPPPLQSKAPPHALASQQGMMGPPPQTLQQLQGIGKYGISMSYLDGYLLI